MIPNSSSALSANGSTSQNGGATSQQGEDMDDVLLQDAYQASKKEIEFRKRSVKNMWFIIITIFLVDTYNTLYSLTLFFWADPQTCFVQDSSWVKSLSTVMQRSIQFIWWLYPVLCLFWPGELDCRRKKKKRRAASHSNKGNDNRRKQSSSTDGVEEEEDDGTESEYDASSTSYVNLNQDGAGTAMFGGPSANVQQPFFLLQNPALAASRDSMGGNAPLIYNSNVFSSGNDVASNVSRHEGTFHISTSPNNSINRGGSTRKASKHFSQRTSDRNHEFAMISPNSDFSDKDF